MHCHGSPLQSFQCRSHEVGAETGSKLQAEPSGFRALKEWKFVGAECQARTCLAGLALCLINYEDVVMQL